MPCGTPPGRMPDSSGSTDEELRLQAAYRLRAERQVDTRYDPLEPAGRWGMLESERILLQGLSRVAGTHPRLKTMEILEVGCGRGGNLMRLAALGVPPERLHGIDLIPARIAEARQLHAGIEFLEGNAAATPWSDQRFDIVLQWVCLSSVLDPGARLAIATEMRRLLKPGGAILSFDFVWNPKNPDTTGIPVRELRRLFPGCRMDISRVYLAPPLARPLARLSWPLTALLAGIPWLCLHRLAIVRPV